MRVLVDSSGEEIEELPPGKKVDQRGCRVRIKPKDWDDIHVWLWTIDQAEKGLGARAIANRLTARGSPTPAAGLRRKRNGVHLPVAAAWHSETVMQLLRNPVIIGLQAYGRQSNGRHKRWSLEGSRAIDDRDVSVGDEGCGELVHGHKQHGELKYICSRSEYSDGKECEHNTVLS